MSELVRIITSEDPEIRNQPLDAFCRDASMHALFGECMALDKLFGMGGTGISCLARDKLFGTG